MNKFIILLLLSLSIISQANAGVCFANYCDAKISVLYIHPNTNIYLQLDTDTSPLTCAPDAGGIILEKTHEMHAEIYSALLSTSMSQSEIRVRTTDVGRCEILYIQIRR